MSSDAHVEETIHPTEGLAVNGETTPAEAQPSLEERLAEAEAEAARNLDGWQRARADFANARRRLDKQLSEAYVNARVDIASRLLPLLDDFALAMSNAPGEIVRREWFTGLQLIERKMTNILDSIQIERIPSVGQLFDPQFHEAVMQEESDQYESGIVIRELQSGYKIGDRVLRPAMVVVAA